MLTRLMFGGGGTAQVLIMQADSNGESKPSYGYSSGLGKISPDYIMYQGEKYVISYFFTSSGYHRSYLSFKNNKIPNGDKMVIEVNGTVYTLVKRAATNEYHTAASLFTSVGTYIIKILSIEWGE